MNGGALDAVGDYFVTEHIVAGVRRGCFSYFTAFPDLHSSIDELIAEGDKVFCRSTMTGPRRRIQGHPAHQPPRRERERGGVSDRGRQVHYWCLTNVAGLMRQLTEEHVATA